MSKEKLLKLKKDQLIEIILRKDKKEEEFLKEKVASDIRISYYIRQIDTLDNIISTLNDTINDLPARVNKLKAIIKAIIISFIVIALSVFSYLVII